MINTIVLSLLVGAGIGLIYGLSFALQQRRVFASYAKHNKLQNIVSISLFSLARLSLLAFTWYYMLRWTEIDFILVLPSFFITFWFITITKRPGIYERR